MYDVRVICVYVQIYSTACIWQLKDNLCETAFYLHYVISRDGTQVIRFVGKCLHPIGHLAGLHLQTLPRDNHLQQPVVSLVFICPSLPLDSLLFPYRHSFLHALWKYPANFLFLSKPPDGILEHRLLHSHQGFSYLSVLNLTPMIVSYQGLFSPFAPFSKTCLFSQIHYQLQTLLCSHKEYEIVYLIIKYECP